MSARILDAGGPSAEIRMFCWLGGKARMEIKVAAVEHGPVPDWALAMAAGPYESMCTAARLRRMALVVQETVFTDLKTSHELMMMTIHERLSKEERMARHHALRHRLDDQLHMVWAFTLENVIKAARYGQDPTLVENGKLALTGVKGHDLLPVAKEIDGLELSDEEEAVLTYLTTSIFSGRYPTEPNAKKQITSRSHQHGAIERIAESLYQRIGLMAMTSYFERFYQHKHKTAEERTKAAAATMRYFTSTGRVER